MDRIFMKFTIIDWFVDIQGHMFLCRVPYEFMEESHNLLELDTVMPKFEEALGCLLERRLYSSHLLIPNLNILLQLYGLIHARYIVSSAGIKAMSEKYLMGHFGCCPRHCCNSQFVLPVGMTSDYGISTVKVYCPSCRDIFHPSDQCLQLDGAMFGPSFPHFFFMCRGDLLPKMPSEKYIPRLFGFKLHESILSIEGKNKDESDSSEDTLGIAVLKVAADS